MTTTDMYRQWLDAERAAHAKTRDDYFETLRRPPWSFFWWCVVAAAVFGVVAGLLIGVEQGQSENSELTSAQVRDFSEYSEHDCSTDWDNWPRSVPVRGALVADRTGDVSHVPFGEGWAALSDLDDGLDLVAVCGR